MRQIKAMLSSPQAILAVAVFVVVAASSPACAQQTVFGATLMEAGQAVPEVSTEELRAILNGKSAVVFDARPFAEFSISHIPGSVNVAPKPGQPASLYVSDVAEVGRLVAYDRNAPMILYCNGPFCGKSKRLSEELVAAGYTNVRRYQLGIPTWRALVGLTQIGSDGVRYVWRNDMTAVFIDARSQAEFITGSLLRARNIPLSDVKAAKDDGRLPMEDHNTRIVVFGSTGAQARAVANEVAKNAFHNVSFYDGTYNELRESFGLNHQAPIDAVDRRP